MTLQDLCADHETYLKEAPRVNSVHVVLNGDIDFILYWSKSEATNREGIAIQLVDDSLVPIIYPLDNLEIKSIKKINEEEAFKILNGGNQ